MWRLVEEYVRYEHMENGCTCTRWYEIGTGSATVACAEDAHMHTHRHHTLTHVYSMYNPTITFTGTRVCRLSHLQQKVRTTRYIKKGFAAQHHNCMRLCWAGQHRLQHVPVPVLRRRLNTHGMTSSIWDLQWGWNGKYSLSLGFGYRPWLFYGSMRVNLL